ncbi:MAG: molybdenum cofactor guanylyltransferase MobA [Thiohalospira sp.]
MATPDPSAEEVAGVVLCGGRGRRMGGRDKGLVPLGGRPLAERAACALAPQVARLCINANRNRETYAGLGWPLCPDTVADLPGPLAGFLAGLEQSGSWLVTVPGDTPRPPADLVERLLAGAREAGVPAALAHDGQRRQPVFALIHRDLRPRLEAALAAGNPATGAWLDEMGAVEVPFPAATPFAGVNTEAEWRQREAEGV